VALGIVQQAVAAFQIPFGFVPFIDFLAGDLFRQIRAFQGRPVGGHGHQGFGVDSPLIVGVFNFVGGQVDDHAVGRAAVADAPGQAAGIDAADRHQFVGLEPFVEAGRGAVVGRIGDVGAQHTAAHGGLVGFDIFEVGPDVADVGEGKGDDLTGVRWIGQGFLITRQAGVETHLTQRDADGACAAAPKHGTVRQHQGGVAACRAGGVEVIDLMKGLRRKIRPLRLGGGVLSGVGHGRRSSRLEGLKIRRWKPICEAVGAFRSSAAPRKAAIWVYLRESGLAVKTLLHKNIYYFQCVTNFRTFAFGGVLV